MMISTKGRYALRVMVDLAEHRNGEYIPMKEVAQRQEISLKYLEKIIPPLTKSGMIEGQHGKGGGYRLNREPDEYHLWDILLVTEGSLAPVSCLEDDAPACSRAPECRTLPLWKDFYKVTKEFFSSRTLADLMQTEQVQNYVI